MPAPVTRGRGSIATRVAVAFVVTWAGLLLAVGAARADDLLLLNGDSITLSGSQHYGFVYVDGAVRLAGDTSISANTIYIGPNAYLDTCFVAGAGDNGCANGRSLTLSASGRLTVSSRIDLTGGTGAPRSGGNLRLSGNPVTVGGDITTAGESGGASGTITIASGSALSTESIYAPSAAVILGANGPIDVGGAVNTYGTDATPQPDAARVQSAGPVSVTSNGDVRIDGDINASGRDAPSSGTLGGGDGAAVAISGSSVRLGAVDVTGGSSSGGSAGSPAAITISARNDLNVLGRLNASGQSSTTGAATGGNHVTLSARGPLTAAGGVHVDGATGATGGSAGGRITLTGAGVTAGDLTAQGGQAPNGSAPPPAGPGGSIAVQSSRGASLGATLAGGGNAYNGGIPGAGGTIMVSSGLGALTTGAVATRGGYTTNGPGTNGGPVTLATFGDLTVGGALDASGSDANGLVDPPRNGGNAGNVVLRASAGTLSLDGGVDASGGSGSRNPTDGHLGGSGGRGGRIDAIAHALGPITTVSSAGGRGGDYNADQGPGGAGGPIFAWTDAPLFDSQKVVDSDGGDGKPTGPAGTQQSDASPTALTESGGTLRFTPRSPDAQGYRLVETLPGGRVQTVLQTTSTTDLRPKVPICAPATFVVVAFNASVGWTSDPSAPVRYTRPASPRQGCGQAPRLSVGARVHRSLAQLRRAGWRANVGVTANGVGKLSVTFEAARGLRGPRRTLLAGVSISRPGHLTLRLRVPISAHRTGTYLLHLITTSPDRRRHATTTLTLEIGP